MPDDVKKGFQYLLQKVKARIEQLESGSGK